MKDEIRTAFSDMWSQLEATGEAKRIDAVSKEYNGTVTLPDGTLATAAGRLTYGNRYGNSWGPLTVVLPDGQQFRTNGVVVS